MVVHSDSNLLELLIYQAKHFPPSEHPGKSGFDCLLYNRTCTHSYLLRTFISFSKLSSFPFSDFLSMHFTANLHINSVRNVGKGETQQLWREVGEDIYICCTCGRLCKIKRMRGRIKRIITDVPEWLLSKWGVVLWTLLTFSQFLFVPPSTLQKKPHWK